MPNSGAMEAPAMTDPMIDGGASPMMGGMDTEGADTNMMPPADPNMGSVPMNNEFDADFDAGVEVDEESDPKKFIQQLTGKLSQSLRKYNEGLPQPDADLNKYVAGMVVKQCIEGLTQEDAQEILDKINSDEQPMEPETNQQESDPTMEQQPMDQQPVPDQNIPQQPQMNETVSKRQAITSRYEELTNDNKENNNTVQDRNSYHKRPWVGKTFKS